MEEVRSKLLEFFEEELGLLKENNLGYVDAQREIQQNEKIVGEMNEFEKQCYITILNLEIEYLEICGDGEYYKLRKFWVLHEQEFRRLRIIKDLMWLSIRNRIETTEFNTLGLRKNFKIVECQKKDPVIHKLNRKEFFEEYVD